jgi:hypothetical protein
MQTSALLAVVAAALPVGLWVLMHWPKIGVFFWGAVIFLVGWLGALGVADLWATKRYYEAVRHDYRVEQATLEAELRRIQQERGNGKPTRPLPGIDVTKKKRRENK